MCVMASDKGSVGVRQLRQYLSVYLRRVAAGESLRVTDRGSAVAALTPLPAASTALERLVAAGRARAPQGDLLALGIPPGRASRGGSAAIEREREERL